jgi:hypothetical protein
MGALGAVLGGLWRPVPFPPEPSLGVPAVSTVERALRRKATPLGPAASGLPGPAPSGLGAGNGPLGNHWPRMTSHTAPQWDEDPE